MSVLQVNGLAKSFGIHDLFKDVSFRLARGERAGFVGANGAGKTTLLNCLLGREEYDAGVVSFDSAVSVGCLEQQAELGDGTLYDEFMDAFGDIIALEAKKEQLEAQIAAGADDEETMDAYARLLHRFEHLEGYDFESRLRRIAFGLGFTEEELQGSVVHLSGGQRTRVALAKALLREPDFLFLDEPTNHLDIGMIEWLEEFLLTYKGAVLIISHDRFFLDKVATKILELDGGTVTTYEGNYTYFQKVKAARRAALESAYAKQQEHIRQTEEYIRRYKAGIKAKQARGRQSQLNRLERIVLPPETAAFNYFAFNAPEECAQRVVELEEVGVDFPDRTLFKDISCLVRRGDGVAIVGPNGVGKTTLLRLIVGERTPSHGSVKLGNRVQIGYFSQQHEGLHLERSVLNEILYEYGCDEEQARSWLGAFLFKGDSVERIIGTLSGGEQSRLAFLKLMLTGANLLILDEPTNHLDIPAKEAVEEALMAFPGTFIVVSHDRYFLDKVANVTLEMSEGRLTEYGGGYSYYREKKAQAAKLAAEEAAELAAEEAEKAKKRAKAAANAGNGPKAAQSGLTPADTAAGSERAQGNANKKRREENFTNLSDAKREEMLQRAEAEIAMAEMELKMLEREMNDPGIQADPAASMRIAEEYAAKEKEIEERYARWERLSEG